MKNEILCFELDDAGRDYVRAELARVLRKGADTPECFNIVVMELEAVTGHGYPCVELPGHKTADGQPYTLAVPGSMYTTHYMTDDEQEEYYLRAGGEDEYGVDLPDFATTGDIDGDILYHAIRDVLEAAGVHMVTYDGRDYLPTDMPEWENIEGLADPSDRDAFLAEYADAFANLVAMSPDGRWPYRPGRRYNDELLAHAFCRAAELGAAVLNHDKWSR